jgi:starch-binding outer membrane protein, SusD/RagB family
MNKYINKILISSAFVLGVLGFVSCSDYLDKSPLSVITSDEAYKNFKNFQGFTEELYSALPLITASDYHNSWNWGEDEIWETGEVRPFSYRVDQGDYWAWNTTGYSWLRSGGVTYNGVLSDDRFNKGCLYGLCWQAIRKANLGIANLDKMTDATDEEKNLIAGQLYFFRGFYHFMLMQFWGGLPYVDYVIPSDAVFDIPRLSYHATADKAAIDFQKAADLLPVDWDATTAGSATTGNNSQRINQIMALGYLGKDLLWAGSPLMNYQSTGSKTYNTDYCKKAADAFAQVLTICESTKRYELVPFSAYSQLFYTYKASGRIPGFATVDGHVYRESIFNESLVSSAGRWLYNQVNDYRPPCLMTSGVKVYPTANYVDYFGMANGLPIADATVKDPVSGYDPEYPWKNRDPRFYTNIVYDGVQCSLASKADSVQYASLYNKGWYRKTSNTNKAAKTGYMEKKFVSQYDNDWDGYKNDNVVVLSLMRLADVYLMYAEATTEGYGTPQSTAGTYSLSALDAVNKVRDRAGVGHVASQYTGSTDAFMPELRRERAVELAFEGHRFTDLRRWLLLTEKPYTYKKAVNFDRANDVTKTDLYANPQNGHVKNLTETVLLERNLGSRHYWLPFLKADVSLYAEFYQNPGW